MANEDKGGGARRRTIRRTFETKSMKSPRGLSTASQGTNGSIVRA